MPFPALTARSSDRHLVTQEVPLGQGFELVEPYLANNPIRIEPGCDAYPDNQHRNVNNREIFFVVTVVGLKDC